MADTTHKQPLPTEIQGSDGTVADVVAGALKVTGSSGGGTEYDDGDAVGAGASTLISGSDGSNVYNIKVNTDGEVVTVGGNSPIDDSDVYTANITGTGDTTLVSAAAGETIRVHKIIITNTAGSIPCGVEFKMGSGSYKHQTHLGTINLTRVLTFSPAVETTTAADDFVGRSTVASVDVDVTVHAEILS